MANDVIVPILYSQSIPVELADLDALSVTLGQEIDGPPDDLVNSMNNLYNVFWLERNETGGFMGCVRKGISFGKHQTGRLVSVICIKLVCV